MFSSLYCGKKGPLKLEPELLPGKVENFKISQVGDSIRLKWDFPAKLSDEKTDLDTEKITKIEVYYSTKEILGGKFLKKSTLLRKLEMKDVFPYSFDNMSPMQKTGQVSGKQKKKENLSFAADIPFKSKDLTLKTHFLALRYFYGKKKSPLGDVIAMITITPLKQIEGLTATIENKLVKLQWNKPLVDAEGIPVSNITGYKVFRKVIPPKTGTTGEEPAEADVSKVTTPVPVEEPFRKINISNVLTEYYQDSDTGKDGEYQYYVSAVVSSDIESSASPIVSLKVTDVFAPEIPMNLVSFKASDHIFLTWRQVQDTDLSHYRVYRKTAEDGEFTVIADKVTSTQYKDTAVQKGTWYFYSISAVDTKGNESELSQGVKEEFL